MSLFGFDRHYTNQIRDPSVLFEERDSSETGEEAWAPAGEVVVGGVYLKLFLQNPTWSLRSPKRFLQELLTETLASLHKDSSEVTWLLLITITLTKKWFYLFKLYSKRKIIYCIYYSSFEFFFPFSVQKYGRSLSNSWAAIRPKSSRGR